MDVVQLFADHHRPLCRYLMRFTGDSDVAADAAQEAFVRAMNQKPTPANPRAWLYTVATNIARDEARTRSRRALILAQTPEDFVMSTAAPDPAMALDASERRATVQRALLELSEKERTALLMREEGFAQREIADALGTTIGTVGSLTARALVKLAQRLNIEKEGEGR
jgi:RNA polymerase sigma-70 factor (ECF subfamily)